MLWSQTSGNAARRRRRPRPAAAGGEFARRAAGDPPPRRPAPTEPAVGCATKDEPAADSRRHRVGVTTVQKVDMDRTHKKEGARRHLIRPRERARNAPRHAGLRRDTRAPTHRSGVSSSTNCDRSNADPDEGLAFGSARLFARSRRGARRAAGARASGQLTSRRRHARRRLLSEGTTAYGRGDYATALDKFTAAYKIFPSPKLWFNIGQANRDLGRPVEAVDGVRSLLDRRGRRAGRDAGRGAPLSRRAQDQAWADQGDVHDRRRRDNRRRQAGRKRPLGDMIWTTPGRHQVAAQQVGFSPAIADVTAVAGKAVVVNLDLRPIDLRAANQPADGALMVAETNAARQRAPGRTSRSNKTGLVLGRDRRRGRCGRHRRGHPRERRRGGGSERSRDDARSAEGVLMRRMAQRYSCWRCASAAAGSRARGRTNRRGRTVDRGHPRDLQQQRSGDVSDPGQRAPRQRRDGQRIDLPQHRDRPDRSNRATRWRC